MSDYDTSCITYNSDGRILQIDYAAKCVEQYGLGIGLRVSDGVVLGIQRTVTSPLREDPMPRIFRMTKNVVVLVIGMLPDGRALCDQVLQYVQDYQKNYGVPAPAKFVAEMMANYMHMYTMSDLRPFGVSCLITDGDNLYQVVPSGDLTTCFAAVAGAKQSMARVEVEKLMGTEPPPENERFKHLRKLYNHGGAVSSMTLAEGVQVVRQISAHCQEDVGDQQWNLQVATVTRDGKLTLE